MRRRLIFILVAFIILVGGSLAVLYAVNRSPKLQNAVYKATNTSLLTNTITNKTNTAVVKPAVTPDREAITFVVRNFSERYGSFSNQNNGSNLVAAQDFTTSTYTTYLNQQVKNIQTITLAAEYSGTVTKALAFTFTSQTTTAAQVVVSTQQSITTGELTKVQTRDLLVDLQKVSGSWKVNAAVWK